MFNSYINISLPEGNGYMSVYTCIRIYIYRHIHTIHVFITCTYRLVISLEAGMVPRPWCWMPSLVRLLGKDRVVGSSKLNSGHPAQRKALGRSRFPRGKRPSKPSKHGDLTPEIDENVSISARFGDSGIISWGSLNAVKYFFSHGHIDWEWVSCWV